MNAMHHPHRMSRARRPRTAAASLAAIVLGAVAGAAAPGEMYQQAPMPGGVQAQSTITSITQQGTNVTVSWYGMQGWYSVERAPLGTSNWTSVGRTAASDYAWGLTVTNVAASNSIFRLNQTNAYVGSGGCAGCHGGNYGQWVVTGHANAYSSIANLPPAARQDCIVCHSVGYGQPTGFVSITNTPHLADVGCESCHGPAAWHKYSDHDLVHPAVTLAAEVCGGCHDGFHHPTYSEWTNTAHSVVTPDVAGGSSGITNVANGPGRQMSCGPCHSGATRLAMLKQYEAVQTGIATPTSELVLPLASDAAKYAVTCALCHDPHSNTADPRQTRNPVFSTNFFTLFTGAGTTTLLKTNFAGIVTTNTFYNNTVFATQYNAGISLCGQCHNTRGARWDGYSPVSKTVSFSRPPHHSPQYNMLVGIIQPDYLNGTNNILHPHGLNTNGCAQCHMHKEAPISPSETNPVYTGHKFEVVLTGCVAAGCHGSTNSARIFMEGIREEVSYNVASVVALLNQWAIAKGTNLFGAVNATKYKENGWEYTTPGSLATITNAGPSSADQLKIPNPIKQARFNIYMVSYAQSGGVHNPNYARYLIDDASAKVQAELNAP